MKGCSFGWVGPPKMITTLVLLVLFEFFGHSCVLRYVKPTILAIFGSPRLAQNGQFGAILKLKLK